jgi:hypothetical protein
MKFPKRKKNLQLVEGVDGFKYVKSYDTLVARIEPGVAVHQLGWWSVTTQKHINYAAAQLGLPVKK